MGTIAYIYLFLCIFLWGFIPVVSKIILKELTNIEMLFYSSILSSFIMFIILISRGKLKEFKKYTIRDYLIMSFLGFLGVFLYYILLYGAFSKIPASEGFILAYTWPILLVLLSSIILKERLNIRKIIAILTSFIGIIIIVTKGDVLSLSFTNLYGDVLAISGALVFALFSLLGKRYNFDKILSVFFYFFISVLLFIPIFLFQKPVFPSLKLIPFLIINGFFINGISYIFWFKALEYGKTHIISNLLYLTPFVSLVYISTFSKEKILPSSILGLIIITLGIIIQGFDKFKFKEVK